MQTLRTVLLTREVIMKKAIWILAFALSGTFAFAQGGGYADDLYQSNDRKAKKSKTTNTKTTAATTVNATPAAPVNQATDGGSSYTSVPQGAAWTKPESNTENKELVPGFDEALQRRLDAYKSYQEMDDEFWKLMEGYHKLLSSKYDQDYYNVVAFGNDMWVEPKYVTAMFDGSDPLESVQNKQLAYDKQPKTSNTNVTINLIDYGGPWGWRYYDPWYYGRSGWSFGVGWSSGWGWNVWTGYNRPYYPHYGWGPGWYDPWWGWGGYYRPHHHHNHYYGGHYRPHYYGRPVVWGGNHYSGGGRPASYARPGGRPNSSGYRRNESGTNVAIRPGGSGNGYQRPAASAGQGTVDTRRPSGTNATQDTRRPNRSGSGSTATAPSRGESTTTTERQPRRESTTTNNRQSQQTTTRESRRETVSPSNNTPSRSSGTPSGGSRGGSSGGSSGGGSGAGGRRR